MNKLIILVLLAVSLCPAIGHAQDDETIDFGTIVEQMSAQCPYTDGRDWAITSVAMAGDTIAVEMETPASISGFLSALTGKSLNVKRLWLDHLKGYGDDWLRLFELMAEEGQSLMLIIKPKRSTDCHSVFITGQEIGTILANH